MIHLLGNHELKKMSLEEIENIWHEQGFNQKSYGYNDMGDFTLIWLGMELDLKITELASYQLIK